MLVHFIWINQSKIREFSIDYMELLLALTLWLNILARILSLPAAVCMTWFWGLKVNNLQNDDLTLYPSAGGEMLPKLWSTACYITVDTSGILYLKGSVQAGAMWLFRSDFPSCSVSNEIWHSDSFSVKKCPWIFFSTSGETRLQTRS